MDAKDILLGGRVPGPAPPPGARKSKEAAPAKPKGVSREARCDSAFACFRACALSQRTRVGLRSLTRLTLPVPRAPQVWQITQGYSADAGLPAPPLIPTAGFKEKRKGAATRKARMHALRRRRMLAARMRTTRAALARCVAASRRSLALR
jgi:hypothetical protein